MINQLQRHFVITLWANQRIFSEAVKETLLKRFFGQHSVSSGVGGYISRDDFGKVFSYLLVSNIAGLKKGDKAFGVIFPCPVNIFFNDRIGNVFSEHFPDGIVAAGTIKSWMGLLKRIPMIVENPLKRVFVNAFHGCSLRTTITELIG